MRPDNAYGQLRQAKHRLSSEKHGLGSLHIAFSVSYFSLHHSRVSRLFGEAFFVPLFRRVEAIADVQIVLVSSSAKYFESVTVI